MLLVFAVRPLLARILARRAAAVSPFVAVAGKLGGSAGAARLCGMPWREALAVGALMNTRGLMELVILTVGLDAGVLSPTLFAMFVLMALVTTVMTAPLLALLRVGAQPAAAASASHTISPAAHS